MTEEVTNMTVLVAYASKHGATQGIAEHIAEQLRQPGKQAEARPVEEVSDPSSYDVFVIGSAVYYGSWLKEATEWVHRNQAILAERLVWLWSSGPPGTEVKDTEPQASPRIWDESQGVRSLNLPERCGSAYGERAVPVTRTKRAKP
jgi:menaquinone-dependent protoporphyrinogen IX oxidase